MKNSLAALLFPGMALVCACSSGQTGTLPSPVTANPQSFVLQFAVGTATIGKTNGTASTGLNFVATFRQSNGQNATLQNTPTLTGPAAINPLGTDTHTLRGLTARDMAQYVSDGGPGSVATPPPGYGQSGADLGPLIGVFGDGFAADNLVSANTILKAYPASASLCYGPVLAASFNQIFGTNGTGTTGPYNSARSAELTIPLNAPVMAGGADSIGCVQPGSTPGYAISYYGGPPAWPSPQGYGMPAFFRGYPFGAMTIDTPPVAGTYSLAVAYPTAADYSTYGTAQVSATLPAPAALAPFPPPIVRLQSDGSALVDVNVPAGASEALVQIAVFPCTTANVLAPVYTHYSLLTRQSGPQTLFLSNALGPPDASGRSTPTFCSGGGSFQVSAIAFDYPAFEASYPQSTQSNPAITNGDGHNGTADVSTSAPLQESY